MSFKKYIEQVRTQNKTSKPIVKKTRKSVGDTFDRGEAAKVRQKNRDKYIPPVDFGTASNFAFYGSAEDYYTKAIDYIAGYYPYDGTTTDKELWLFSASHLETHIFENEYPRTNGYIIFSSDGWTTQSDVEDGYGEPATKQYILLNGGLAVGDIVNDTDFTYDLKYGTSAGNCVEFWINKSEFLPSLTTKEVVFDLWNSSSIGESKGRFTVELTGASDVINVSIASGTVHAEAQLTSIASGTLVDGAWHHVALNFSYGASNVTVESYLDGEFKGSQTIAGAIGEVTGNFVAAVGSLVTSQTGSTSVGALGWGKLSASLDDFRFWRKTRDSKSIYTFSRQSLDGGATTGSVNRELGLYFKFNEGITTNATTDATILDYSGRVNNGTFYGYTSTARNTNSAFVLSGLATREFKDPIIYKTHPDVSAYRDDKILSGSTHDLLNGNNIYKTLPNWIVDEDQDNSKQLKSLTQIMASFLDELYLEIKTLPEINQSEYYGDKIFKNKFDQHALNSKGLLIGRILENSDFLNSYYDSDKSGLFAQKLEDIKSVIYGNLNNSAVEIFKTKGTVESLRNALRCFGVDNELINFSIYEDNTTIKLDDKRELYAEKFKFVNFSRVLNNDAIVYPSLSGGVGTPFISGTFGVADPIEARMANTYECQVFLPKYPDAGEVSNVNFVGISSSIFGVHGVSVTSSTDDGTTFSADDAGFQVYAVRDSLVTKKVKFVLTSSVAAAGEDVFPSIETGFFDDTYDNETWNIAVTVKPIGYEVGDQNNALKDGSGSYIVNFRGFNVEDERLYNSFDLTSSFHSTRAIKLLSQNRKPYYGANRTNFTGSLLNGSDLEVGFFRVWLDNLSNSELISHAKDPRNFGRDRPYENFLPLSSEFEGTYVPKIQSLIMNVGTDKLSESDSSGIFTLDDLSSGSYTDTKVEYLNAVLGGLYQAKGFGFDTSSETIYNSRFSTVGKTINPENFGELSGVRILTEDDEATKSIIKAKLAYFVIEKSAQQALNRDIISFFSSLDGFNELIGNPVNKYRMEYKELKKLATDYFATVVSKRTSVAFFEYYKWLDNAINDLLINLLPATLNGSDRIYNVVESHILERNKYQHKLPTIEFRRPDPEAIASGSNNQDWRLSHKPLSDSQADNCFWWKYRADRANTAFGDTGSAEMLNSRRLIHTASFQLIEREQNSPVKLDIKTGREYKGGINFNKNKKIDFYKGVLFNSSSAGFARMAVSASSIELVDCDDNTTDLVDKRELNATAEITYGGTSTSEKFSFDLSAPGSLVSQSVSTDDNYLSSAYNVTNPSHVITNIHHDVFGPDPEQPMQGPFTSQRVGGFKSRKRRLTDVGTRLERFRIDVSNTTEFLIESPRADLGYDEPVDQFYQDPPVRAPVNIKNIRTTGSAVGNFKENYEIVQTSGKSINNFNKADLTGVLGDLDSPYVSGVFDFPVITGAANKTVIREIFGAPGGPDTYGPNLDPVNREFSIYNSLNYRNLGIREPLNTRMETPSSFGGFASGSNDLSASIHKVQRNGTKRMILTTNDAIITSSVFDNGFISRGIPAADFGYHWINQSAYTGTVETVHFGYGASSTVNYGSPIIIQSGFATGSDYTFPTSTLRDFEGNPVVPYEINFVGYTTPGEFSLFAGYHSDLEGNYLVLAPSNYLNSTALTDNVDVYFTNVISHGFGYSSWAQIRGDRHMITRHLRRNNIITYQRDPQDVGNGAEPYNQKETGFYEAQEPAVSYDNPVYLQVDLDPEDSETESTLFAISDNSEKRYFFDNNLQSVLTSKQQKDAPSSYDKLYDFYTSDGAGVLNPDNVEYVKFSHQIYPIQKFSFKKNRLIRDEFTQTWAETITKRSLLKLFDDTPTLDIYKDSSIPNYGGNAMGVKLLYAGALPVEKGTGTGVQGLMSGNAVINSRHPLDTNILADEITRVFGSVRRSVDGTWSGFIPFGITGSNDPSQPYGFVTGTGDHRFYNLRGDNNPTSSQQPDPTYDITSSINMSYGILRDPKNFLNNFIVHVPTGTDGDPNPAADGKIDQSAFQVNNFPSRSWGPLFEMPWISTYDDMNAPWGHYPQFNPSFFEGWRAPTQYGKGPSYYNNHTEFSEFVKIIGKDHTLLPEYRISEHIGEILTGSSELSSDLVSGREVSGSSNATLNLSSYEDGDLLVNFEEFKNKHNFLQPKKLRIRIDAITKLLPYEGFYPAERTVQLVNLFSSSIENALPPTFPTGSVTENGLDPLYDGQFRTALQPLFAPGILYNSIKAGLGINYGMFTGSTAPTIAKTQVSIIGDDPEPFHFLTYAYSGSVSGGFGRESGDGFGRFAGWDNMVQLPGFTKIPFEELITLDTLQKEGWYDMYPDVSMSLGGHHNASASTIVSNKCQLVGYIKPLYQLAMSNFLASSVDFCLKDKSLTTVRSKEQKYLEPASAGNTYKMRLSLTLAEPGQYDASNHQSMWQMAGIELSNGWGPPVSGAVVPIQNSEFNNGGDGGEAFFGVRPTDRIWRPGWGEGEVFVDLEWNPKENRKYSIEEIQNQLTATFSQSNTITPNFPQTGIESDPLQYEYMHFVTGNMPNFGDSVNFLSRLNKTQVEIDPTTGLPIKTIDPLDTSNTVWVIQPKWETPFLTRNAPDDDLGKYTGIWKTLCEIPDENNNASFKLKIRQPDDSSESLKDYLDLPEEAELGKLSEKTKIEEAIVCIPYRVVGQEKSFFQIDRALLEGLLIEGAKEVASGQTPNEWYQLTQLLDKYVFPPAFDFKRNEDILPLGMLIKEYSVALDKEDISLFWQNLPPKPLAEFDVDTSFLEVNLETTQLFPLMLEETNPIKFIVFKVKKRAKTNYFAMTAQDPAFAAEFYETLDIGGGKFTVEDYSYNYPYDFCSLVETAKITAEVDFVKEGLELEPE